MDTSGKMEAFNGNKDRPHYTDFRGIASSKLSHKAERETQPRYRNQTDDAFSRTLKHCCELTTKSDDCQKDFTAQTPFRIIIRVSTQWNNALSGALVNFNMRPSTPPTPLWSGIFPRINDVARKPGDLVLWMEGHQVKARRSSLRSQRSFYLIRTSIAEARLQNLNLPNLLE